MKILWTLLALGWFYFMTHLAINTIYTTDPGLAGPAILVTTIITVGYLARNGAK
jgi:hypothetical protein